MLDLTTAKRLILDRVGILDLVSTHVNLKRTGRRWVGLCPFHNEKTPSFTVSPDQGFFKCFGCGKGGDVFSFVQLRENVPFMDAMEMLADRAGVELPKTTSTEASKGAPRAEVLRANAWALTYFRDNLLNPTLGKSTRAYVAKRGISEECAGRFGIGLAPDGDLPLRAAAQRAGFSAEVLIEADLVRSPEQGRVYDTFRNRLMFPIRDVTAKVIGFGGRTLADDPAKYLNTRQNSVFDKGKGLYAIDQARDAIVARRRAILVEGYTDCIAAHQAGFPETVASLGTALTEFQVELLRRYCDHLILLFDSDQAGQTAAERAVRVAIPWGIKVELARIPDGKDPAEFLANYPPERFADVLKGGVDALEFAWTQTLRRYSGESSNVARRQAILDFVRVVGEAFNARAVDDIQRGLVANQIAHLLRIDREEAYRLLAGQRTAPYAKTAAPSPNPGPVKAVAPSGEHQAAWQHVLGVMLNEPGAAAGFELLAHAGLISDPRDRRIAEVAFQLQERLGDFNVGDVLAELHDEDAHARVFEMARVGAERGNFENTMRVAAERIERAARLQSHEANRQRVVGEGEASEHPLSKLQAGMKEGHPFLPVRWRRRVADLGPSAGSDQPSARESV